MIGYKQDTVLFIHGAWVTPRCWRYFTQPFVRAGLHVLTPAWPLKNRPLEQQTDSPDPELAKVGIPEILDHYKAIIDTLEKPPILIGHSFGGLIVQLLLDQGYGAGGIAISSVPPRGVMPLRLFSRKSWETLHLVLRHPLSWCSVLQPPPPSERVTSYFVPESGRIFWQLFSRHACVDFTNAAAPLLLVACGKDQLIPSATVLANFEKYQPAEPRDVAYIDFLERTHLSIAEQGCEEVAECCLQWAQDHMLSPQQLEAVLA